MVEQALDWKAFASGAAAQRRRQVEELGPWFDPRTPLVPVYVSGFRGSEACRMVKRLASRLP